MTPDTKQKIIDWRKEKCSANKRLRFKGAVIVPLKRKYDNSDYSVLDLVFSEKIIIRVTDPRKSIIDRSKRSIQFQWLFKALGEDFLDIPPAKNWDDFLEEVTTVLNRYKDQYLYCKITIDADGFFISGEGKCFSDEPDMEYTDSDTHFLLEGETVDLP